MKKFFLLAIILVSLSVKAQTGISKTDSLARVQYIQDSIRDKELLDFLMPLEHQQSSDEVTPPAIIEKTVAPEPVIPVEIKTEPNPIPLAPTDTTKNDAPKVISPNQNQDTLLPPEAPLDTLRPKEVEEVIKTTLSAPDSLKPKSQNDTLTIQTIPPDTINPAAKQQDSLFVNPSPPDSLVPNVTHNAAELRLLPIDSLTSDQLLLYYQTEPYPEQFYIGPKQGDSLYYILNPLTIPTTTLEGEPLSRHMTGLGDDLNQNLDSSSAAEQRLKPKISIGVGRMGFHGDLYNKHFQTLSMGRPAFDLSISHRITRYLQLDFNVLFGKVGANERIDNRNENFRSEIRAGGVNLIYDFGNFIPSKYKVRPFVSFGVYGFEFLSKTDLKDKNGNTYYYWNDGSIKSMPEGSPGAQNAIDLQRDYTYESDIRELNKDGFGKYQERAFAFPLGLGFIMKVTDRVDLKLNFQYYLTTTDYIDGVSNKSVGDRAGTKGKDKLTYTSFSLQYDLIAKKKSRTNKYIDTLSNAFWATFDNEDGDDDGVIDLQDDCLGTEKDAKVDLKGCPLDEDNDGIPSHRDDELASAAGAPVNSRGVTQDDAYWQNWYDNYLNDSLVTNRSTVTVGNIFAAPVKAPKVKKDNFTVELVRYAGPIPSDELAFLLSIGDINSVTLDDGTTVVYTSGNYDKLSTAIKRRDEFRTTGNKGAGISRITGNGKEIVQVGDEELQRLLETEIADLLNISVGDSVLGTILPEEVGVFTKEDIVYRVQLGAFKNKISTKVFNTSAGVLELKTGESIYRYVTKGYKSIGEAAGVRADLVVQGYSDAFVTAYKGGKRIPMNQTGATMDKDFKEDLNEEKTFNSIDKKLLVFKIQLGPTKKPAQEQAMDEKVKDITTIEKQTTATGNIRYTAGGEFSRLDTAEKLRKDLEDKGYTDAFIIATFKNEIISIQEAMELLK
ncbi:SPOR domain-containing protein [Aurantibacillus circumpalustris]|uniref:SPOR domain-containing protein n=1 Tax=Aurantibacillus circumpalustris TaxID=3036359 RepID=UPI00295A84D2|nr:SPOR domain-containing protein [Aurantibacillus circumpalustris]